VAWFGYFSGGVVLGMDGDEIPVFDVDLDQDPLLRWKAIAAAPWLYLPTFMPFMSIMV
jgi:hypothetical protein